jgi:MoaA/NifB/PqqE/SkfB family radical SAM enzyme
MRKSLLSTASEGFRRLLYLIPSHPEVAQIEVTNRCNFNCAMCQRIPLKVPIKDMDFSLYKKVIDRLGPIKEVTLTGWGEPLMHPKIVEMIKYAKDKRKRVCLTLNGSLLTENLAKRLIKVNLDSISFSIDEIKTPKSGTLAHPITIQIKNIENFMKMIRDRKERPEAIIQTTLHQGKEKEILEVLKWASKIGTDLVNLNRLDIRFNKKLKRPNFEQEKQFVKKLDEVGKKYKIQTEFRPHVAFSGNNRKIYRALAPFMHRGGKHCLRVYNYLYVNLKGKVTPCCALPLWTVGDLLEEDLDDIWRSEKFKRFREHDFQRKICGQCDVLEVKQYS